MEIKSIIRYAPFAVGLMEIEHLIRYAPRAVGLKPSAIRGEARLRGLYRNNSSKTISHFCAYYHLEQYEDILRRARYADADLFDDPDNDPCHRYVVLRDLKMLEALEADTKENTV